MAGIVSFQFERRKGLGCGMLLRCDPPCDAKYLP